MRLQSNSSVLITVRRFSERDLLMREHWGLGVGHIHAHNKPSPSERVQEPSWWDDIFDDEGPESEDGPYGPEIEDEGDEPVYAMDDLQDDVVTDSEWEDAADEEDEYEEGYLYD